MHLHSHLEMATPSHPKFNSRKIKITNWMPTYVPFLFEENRNIYIKKNVKNSIHLTTEVIGLNQTLLGPFFTSWTWTKSAGSVIAINWPSEVNRIDLMASRWHHNCLRQIAHIPYTACLVLISSCKSIPIWMPRWCEWKVQMPRQRCNGLPKKHKILFFNF